MAQQPINYVPQGGFGGANRAAFVQGTAGIAKNVASINQARKFKDYKAKLGQVGPEGLQGLLTEFPEFQQQTMAVMGAHSQQAKAQHEAQFKNDWGKYVQGELGVKDISTLYPEQSKKILEMKESLTADQENAEITERAHNIGAFKEGADAYISHLEKKMAMHERSGNAEEAKRLKGRIEAAKKDPKAIEGQVARDKYILSILAPDAMTKMADVALKGAQTKEIIKKITMLDKDHKAALGKIANDKARVAALAKAATNEADKLQYQKDRDIIEDKQKTKELEYRKERDRLEDERKAADKGKPSVTQEKSALTAEQESMKARVLHSKAGSILQRLDEMERTPGLIGTMTEELKAIIGSEDDVSLLRKDMDNFANLAIRAQRVAGEGPMSENDLKLLSKGVPPSSASTEVWRKYLTTAMKYSGYAESYARLSAEWKSNVGATSKQAGKDAPNIGGYKVMPGMTFDRFYKDNAKDIRQNLDSMVGEQTEESFVDGL